MAVQKSRKSRSLKKKKRNFKFKIPQLMLDNVANEFHLRHRMTKKGFYKGVKVL